MLVREKHLKIFNQEEINTLNLFLRRKKTMEENQIFMMRDQGKVLTLPDLDGNEFQAMINWVQQIEDSEYYTAGMTYVGNHSTKDGGSTEWILKKDPEVGFIPMFCTLYW